MNNKLWQVKAFDYDIKDILQKTKNPNKKLQRKIRKLVVLGTSLTWMQAKDLRRKYSRNNAYILPFKMPKLEVIKLS